MERFPNGMFYGNGIRHSHMARHQDRRSNLPAIFELSILDLALPRTYSFRHQPDRADSSRKGLQKITAFSSIFMIID